ncbi:MAG: carboxypeptidase-like regulatory domain-containing protein [Candidatus Polarisedimenticolia bacterium]
MRSRGPAILAFILLITTVPAFAKQRAGKPETVKGLVAIPAPHTRMVGAVLQKDGVTPVRGAQLRLTNLLDGEVSTISSDEDGSYDVPVLIGRYSLSIERRMEIYDSPSHYLIPARGPVTMNFLLLPDFESNGSPAPFSAHDLPAPRPEAERVVGSIVDMVPQATKDRTWRWRETLAFVGAALVVGFAAN